MSGALGHRARAAGPALRASALVALAIALGASSPRALVADESIPALVARLEHADPATRAAAAAALGARGANAAASAPALLERVADPDTAVRAAVASALGLIARADEPARIAILQAMAREVDPPGPRFAFAVDVLAALGPAAVAELVAAAEHGVPGPPAAGEARVPSGRSQAATRAIGVLAGFGADAIPAMLARLEAVTGAARDRRTEALAEVMLQVGGAAIAPLAQGLVSREIGARRGAARALGRIHEPAAAIAAHLAPALRDVDVSVRIEAAEALGYCGEAGVAPLLAAWGDLSLAQAIEAALDRVGDRATKAIFELATEPTGPIAPRVAAVALLAKREVRTGLWHAALEGLLSDEAGELRAAACQAFVSGGVPARAVPALARATADLDVAVRRAATLALGRAGVLDAAVRAALLVRLADADAPVRAAAVCALGRGGPPAAPLAEPLSRALANDPDAEVRAAAAGAFAALGYASDSAAERLRLALADPDAAVASNAARALGCVGRDDAGAALVLALADPRAAVRQHAAMALGRIAAPLELVVGPLAASLGDPDSFAAMAAELALRALATRAGGAAAIAPVAVASTEIPARRVRAAYLLSLVGTAAPAEATAALVRLLAHEDLATRRAAATSLGRMPGGVQEVMLPAAVAALDDPDLAVRRGALAAVCRAHPMDEAIQLELGRRLSGLHVKSGSPEESHTSVWAYALIAALAEQERLAPRTLALVFEHAASEGVLGSEHLAVSMLAYRASEVVPLIAAGLVEADSARRRAASAVLAQLARDGRLAADAIGPLVALVPRLDGDDCLVVIGIGMAVDPGPRWVLELAEVGFGARRTYSLANKRAIELLSGFDPRDTVPLLLVEDRGVAEGARGLLLERGAELVPLAVCEYAAWRRAAAAVHRAADSTAAPDEASPDLLAATERLIAERGAELDAAAMAEYGRCAARARAMGGFLADIAASGPGVSPEVALVVRRALLVAWGDPALAGARPLVSQVMAPVPIELEELAGFLEDRATAASAIVWLAGRPPVDDAAAVERLAPGLGHPEPWRRAAAGAAVAYFGGPLDPPVRAALAEGLATAEWREPIALVLLVRGAPAGLELVAGALESGELLGRRDLALRLLAAGSRDRRAIAVAVAALGDPAWHPRASAALAAGGPEACSAVLAALGSPELGTAAVAALRAFPVRPYLELFQALGDPARAGLAQAALDEGGADAAAWLADAALDGDPAVRPRARASLLRLGEDATGALIQALRGGTEARRMAAMALLRAVGPPAAAAVPRLVELLGESARPMRQAAAATLGALRSPLAVEPLLAAHDGADAFWRVSLRRALIEHGEVAVPALVNALANAARREVAVEVLVAIGVLAVEPSIAAMASADAGVAAAAREVLVKLYPKVLDTALRTRIRAVLMEHR